jgi:hypothetical protein
MLISYVVTLKLIYAHGALYLRGIARERPTWVFNKVADLIYRPRSPNGFALFSMSAGAVVMTFLMIMHRRFLWWPVYPLPYVMASTWSLSKIWFSVFIGWLLRTLIERGGNFKVYSRLRPLFIGAIVGEALIIVFWLIVDALTGTVGHNLFPGAN